MLEAFLSRHKKVAFMFSGGKDSAACLKLLRPYLDRITVVWGNPGDPYPETVSWIKSLAIPNLVEVKGDVPGVIATHGHPVEIVPVQWQPKGRKFIPWTTCCLSNIWAPIQNWLGANQITGLIKGQKLSDGKQSPLQHGAVANGIELYHPLETWTDEAVFTFLGEDVPFGYKAGLKSSMDCMHCTAHLAENSGHFPYLAEKHPQVYAEVMETLSDWKDLVAPTWEMVNGY